MVKGNLVGVVVMDESLFATKDELKEILSSLPNDALFAIAEEINVKWKPYTGAIDPKRDINRMRCYEAICNHYFPKRSGKEKINGWRGKTVDELMVLLDKFNIKRPSRDNEKICKMWCVRKLNDAGVNPFTGELNKEVIKNEWNDRGAIKEVM